MYKDRIHFRYSLYLWLAPGQEAVSCISQVDGQCCTWIDLESATDESQKRLGCFFSDLVFVKLQDCK